ncbi:MAG: hypothetical protein QXL01_00800 [Thermoplasmatales archaeon]
MDLTRFENFLANHGVPFRYSGQSIVFKECPECGSQKWKVHLYRERKDESIPFMGKCFAGKCGQTFSSISYLIKIGINKDDVYGIHGKSAEANIKSLLPEFKITPTDNQIAKSEITVNVDVSSFFKFEDWDDHPVVKYASKRGLPRALWHKVMINHDSNSVVFLCHDQGKVVGYQERFIYPFNPNMKTKTSLGFKISEFIEEYENPGKKIVVCEGPFTAASAWVLGYHAICTFGSSMSRIQLSKIAKIAQKLGQPVGFALEKKREGHAFVPDPANQKAFERLSKYLFWQGLQVFKLEPDEKDLNDALTKNKKVLEFPVDNEWTSILPSIDALKEFL